MMQLLIIMMKLTMNACDIAIGKKNILTNVHFELHRGSFIHLKGKNGSGKTVFIQSLLGFNKVTQGTRIVQYKRNEICYIPDAPFFNENESVKDVLHALCFFYNTQFSTLLDVLNHLQFDESVLFSQKIASLSKGTIKKLEIIPLFLDHLNLYFLDEIMTGLDTDALVIVCARLKELHQKGATILMTEHNHHIMDYLHHLMPQIQEVTCVNQKIILD